MKIQTTVFVVGVMLAGFQAKAQLSDEFAPPRANCCLINTARGLADQLQDWNQLSRYHAANQQLKKQPVPANRVVFMGDSITDFWNLEQYFPGKPYVNRGIGGQTTPQMLVRIYPDVIELKPTAMVVLAGINDIARNTGPSTPEMIQQNIMAMTELAQHQGIKVILCSVMPVSDYPFLRAQNAPPANPAPQGPGGGGPPRTKMTGSHPPADILNLNAWMKDYAAKVKATYVDYFGAVVDERGWLKDAYSTDGLHPNAEGYKVMTVVLNAAIQKVLP
ncbi:MAG: SGNH/GDSL hydrolase family protein [Bryobacteraceae bacterium]